MKPTNYLLLTILVIVFAIYGFQQIRKSITEQANSAAKQIRSIR